jgi:hypothetical protein
METAHALVGGNLSKFLAKEKGSGVSSQDIENKAFPFSHALITFKPINTLKPFADILCQYHTPPKYCAKGGANKNGVKS